MCESTCICTVTDIVCMIYGMHAKNVDLRSYEYAKVVFEVANEIRKNRKV